MTERFWALQALQALLGSLSNWSNSRNDGSLWYSRSPALSAHIPQDFPLQEMLDDCFTPLPPEVVPSSTCRRLQRHLWKWPSELKDRVTLSPAHLWQSNFLPHFFCQVVYYYNWIRCINVLHRSYDFVADFGPVWWMLFNAFLILLSCYGLFFPASDLTWQAACVKKNVSPWWAQKKKLINGSSWPNSDMNFWLKWCWDVWK